MSKLEAYNKETDRQFKVVGKDEPNPRYTIVWGRLFRSYTGTTACCGLYSVSVRTKHELRKRVRRIKREVSDLIHILDLRTGKEISVNM